MTFWDGIFKDEKDCIDFRQSYTSFDGERWQRMPLIASLMPTYKCNLKCVYCPFPTYLDNASERSSIEWESLLEQLAAWGVSRVSFSGGEPLLYQALARLINKSSQLGISTGVVTNGTRLTEKMLKSFAELGLNALTVSIDTVDDSLYAIMCDTSFGTISRVLDMVVAAKQLGDYWVGINTVLTKMNVMTVGQTIEFFSRHDIPIQFQIFNPHCNRSDLLPSVCEMERAIKVIKEFKKSGAPISNSDDYLDACCEFVMTRRFPNQMECLIPFVEIVVTPDLKMKTCCNSSVVGDATNVDLDKTWLNDEANRWRTMAKDKSCRDCFLIYHEPLREDIPA